MVLEKSKMRPLTVLNVTWPIYVVERQSVTPGSEIFSLSSFVFRGCAGDKVASMNANCWLADRHSLAQHSVPAGAQKTIACHTGLSRRSSCLCGLMGLGSITWSRFDNQRGLGAGYGVPALAGSALSLGGGSEHLEIQAKTRLTG